MSIKLSRTDVIWSYIGTVLSMTSNLLMLPIIIHYLDSDMLGLWYVFTSLGAIATLFDCGFSITFARNITYCWGGARVLKKEKVDFIKATAPNYELMKKVIDTCKLIYFIISSTALIGLVSFGTIYVRYISQDILGENIYVAWFLYSVAVFLNLYYGYYASFLRGVGAIEDANKNVVIARMAQIVVTLVLLFGGAGIIGVCVGYLVYGTVFRFLGKYKFYKYKNIGNNLKKIIVKSSLDEKKQLFYIVWHNAWRDGVISITDYCCGQVSTIICSMYLSLSETGAYSLGVQLATAISMISGVLYSSYQPVIQEAYINEDVNKQKESLALVFATCIYIFVVGVVGTLFIGLPILRIIKPSVVVSGYIFVGLCLYQFVLRFRNCFTSFFSCTNRIPYVKSFIVSAVLCVAMTYVSMAIFNMGITGLIIAQIFSQLIFNVWYWPMKVSEELNYNIFHMLYVGTQQIIKKLKFKH